MQFSKYHALGNDYIVINPADINTELTCQKIVGICHRNFGVGSDGILLGPYDSESCKFKLKIFNPDGSEAEKSGNGLRIFARYLWDNGLVSNAPFTLETLGGVVTCEVSSDGKSVKVKMGKVSFDSTIIPVNGEPREVLNEQIEIDGKIIVYCAATVGNPHCVIVTEYPTAEETQRLGPQIETNTLFPNRTNVQFMKVLDQNNIQIEIWERGAGYTLASGSSSTAAAAVAHRLGLCKSDIYVHMPGGIIEINLDDDFVATMTGPVVKVFDGVMAKDLFETE